MFKQYTLFPVCRIALLGMMLILFCISQKAMAAESQKPASSFPDSHFIDGAATSEFLWLLVNNGQVLEFDRSSGEVRQLTTTGMLDILRTDERLLGILSENGDPKAHQVIDIISQEPVGPKLTMVEPPFRLIANDSLVVLGKNVLFVLKENEWQRLDLSQPVLIGPQTSTASTNDGTIYIGYNLGEWGGGLWTIEPASGQVSEVRRIDGKVCEGPLGKDCDPVTGVVRDPKRPECVLATIGIMHLGIVQGRILRICGTEVEVVYSKPLPIGSNDFLPNGTWPIYSLSVTHDGWLATSRGSFFRQSNGVVTHRRFPSLESWGGLELTFLEPEVVILKTKMKPINLQDIYELLVIQITE